MLLLSYKLVMPLAEDEFTFSGRNLFAGVLPTPRFGEFPSQQQHYLDDVDGRSTSVQFNISSHSTGRCLYNLSVTG